MAMPGSSAKGRKTDLIRTSERRWWTTQNDRTVKFEMMDDAIADGPRDWVSLWNGCWCKIAWMVGLHKQAYSSRNRSLYQWPILVLVRSASRRCRRSKPGERRRSIRPS